MDNKKNYYNVEITETKKHTFAVLALSSENAIGLVEEAYANGNFDMSDVEGEVLISSNGICDAPNERIGKLSLDYNFNVDIIK